MPGTTNENDYIGSSFPLPREKTVERAALADVSRAPRRTSDGGLEFLYSNLPAGEHTRLVEGVEQDPESPHTWKALITHEEAHPRNSTRLHNKFMRKVFQRAVRVVPKAAFRKDPAYVDIWLAYINLLQQVDTSEAVRDTFKYMKGEGIGQDSAHVYLSWAEFEIKTGHAERAQKILSLGMQRGAAPRTLLEEALSLQFGSTQILRLSLDDDEDEDDADEKDDSFKSFVPAISRGQANSYASMKLSAKTRADRSAVKAKPGFVPLDDGAQEPPRRRSRRLSGLGADVAKTPARSDNRSFGSSGTGKLFRSASPFGPMGFGSSREPDSTISFKAKMAKDLVIPPFKQGPKKKHRRSGGSASSDEKGEGAPINPSAMVIPPFRKGQVSKRRSKGKDTPEAGPLLDRSGESLKDALKHTGTYSASDDPTISFKENTNMIESVCAPDDPTIEIKRDGKARRGQSKRSLGQRLGGAVRVNLQASTQPSEASPTGEAHVHVGSSPVKRKAERDAVASAPKRQKLERHSSEVIVDEAVSFKPQKEASKVISKPLEEKKPVPSRRVCFDEAGIAAQAQQSTQDNVILVNGRPYQALEVVGKGGSSKVYKVIAQNKKILALKRVRIKGETPATIENYVNEITLLQRLRGRDNIVTLVDAEVNYEQHVIYLVMEFGDIDLNRLLQRQRGKGVDDNFLRLYWQQMLEAVHTIHEERIVHGDLKPANFLFVEGKLKLIDFGIAKAIQNDTTNIVRDNQIGTLNYMSPEAILDTSPRESGPGPHKQKMKLGRASDIWSLGCILYQMTHGNCPFSHLHMIPKLQAIINPAVAIDFPPTSNEALSDAIRGCLHRDQNKRYTIPELLNHPFLRPTASPAVPPPVAPIMPRAQVSALIMQLVSFAGMKDVDVNALTDGAMKQIERGEEINLAELLKATPTPPPAGAAATTTAAKASKGEGRPPPRLGFDMEDAIGQQRKALQPVHESKNNKFVGKSAKVAQMQAPQNELQDALLQRLKRMGPMVQDTLPSMKENAHEWGGP